MGKKCVSKIKLFNIIYFFAFFSVLILLIWRCRYGWVSYDESFYLTIPYRIIQGDALFMNEWHLSQMSSFLLLPFMYIYLKIFKSTVGIALAFRFIYIIVQAVASLFIYLKLKRYSVTGAMFASFCFFLFTPYYINALSYNSMGIICLSGFCVIWFTNEKKNKIKYIISGWLFAGSVLCCPYLVFLYFILMFVCIAGNLYSKRTNKFNIITEWIDVKSFAYTTIGIIILALCFLVFVLSRTSFMQLSNSFANLFQDPEHKMTSLFKSLYLLLKGFYKVFGGFIILYFLFFILVVLDRNRNKRQGVYFIVFGILTLYMYYVIYSSTSQNFISIPYTFFTLPINIFAWLFFIFFNKDKLILKLFVAFWIPGIVYSICISFSSNQYLYAFSIAEVVSLIGSCIIIILSFKKITNIEKEKHLRYLTTIILCVLVFTQFTSEGYPRLKKIHFDSSFANQNILVTDGYAKGIYVSNEKNGDYQDIINIRDEIVKKYSKKNNLLSLSINTWIYLDLENYKNASYSAWLSGVNDVTVERLKAYYKICPDKKPDLIYVEAENDEFAHSLAESLGDYRRETLGNKDYLYVLSYE